MPSGKPSSKIYPTYNFLGSSPSFYLMSVVSLRSYNKFRQTHMCSSQQKEMQICTDPSKIFRIVPYRLFARFFSVAFHQLSSFPNPISCLQVSSLFLTFLLSVPSRFIPRLSSTLQFSLNLFHLLSPVQIKCANLLKDTFASTPCMYIYKQSNTLANTFLHLPHVAPSSFSSFFSRSVLFEFLPTSIKNIHTSSVPYTSLTSKAQFVPS